MPPASGLSKRRAEPVVRSGVSGIWPAVPRYEQKSGRLIPYFRLIPTIEIGHAQLKLSKPTQWRSSNNGQGRTPISRTCVRRDGRDRGSQAGQFRQDHASAAARYPHASRLRNAARRACWRGQTGEPGRYCRQCATMLTCPRTCPSAWRTAWPSDYACGRGQLERRCRIGCVVTPKKGSAATSTH